MNYDSRADTLIHSQRVGELMAAVVHELIDRSMRHDRSKTLPPEVETFDRVTPRLKGLTYGSAEYADALDDMGEGLAHHYAENRHHPEHFPDGVNSMTLADLIEMLADWKAATERHTDGDLGKSLEIQRVRFGLGDQLSLILLNTAVHLGWLGSGTIQTPSVEPPLDLDAIRRRCMDVAQGEIESWDRDPMYKVMDASQRDVGPLLAEVRRLRHLPEPR